MGKRIEITLVQPSSSDESDVGDKRQHTAGYSSRFVHNVGAIAQDLPQVVNKQGKRDQKLIPYFDQHPQLNRDQKITLDGKLFRYVRGSEMPDIPHVQIGSTKPLPHSFDRLNHTHKQGHVTDRELKQRRFDDSISVEEYSTDLLRRKGTNYWIKELMKQLETDPGTLKLIPNLAFEIVRNFPVVVFSNKGTRSGRQVSKILEEMQKKHNLKPDTFLEIVLDDSRAGTKTYNDLIMITQMRGLPQIFIGETFIGGFDAIKKLKKFKKLGPMILQSLGFNTWPCKLCEQEKQELEGSVAYPRDIIVPTTRDVRVTQPSDIVIDRETTTKYPYTAEHVENKSSSKKAKDVEVKKNVVNTGQKYGGKKGQNVVALDNGTEYKKDKKFGLQKNIYQKEKSHIFPSWFRKKMPVSMV